MLVATPTRPRGLHSYLGVQPLWPHYAGPAVAAAGGESFTTTTSGVVVESQGAGGGISFQYHSAGVTNGFQSWTSPSSPSDLTGVLVDMAKIGSPTGTVTLSIRAHSGTYGTSSVPTGGDLVASAAYDVTTLGSRDDYFFPLSGWAPDASTYYVVFIDASGVTGGDASNYVAIYNTGGSPTDGNAGYNTSTPQAGNDLNIDIYAVTAAGDSAYNTALSMGMTLSL